MEPQIVFFDDYCVLCSRSVRFIYRNDPGGRFRFASFDSEAFRGIAGMLPGQFQVRGSGGSEASPGSVAADRWQNAKATKGGDSSQPSFGTLEAERWQNAKATKVGESSQSSPGSVVLYRQGREYLRSGAALRIAMLLRFPLPLLAAGFALPPFIRNAIYDWIARKRYRWFGKLETCFVPDEGLRDRFLK